MRSRVSCELEEDIEAPLEIVSFPVETRLAASPASKRRGEPRLYTRLTPKAFVLLSSIEPYIGFFAARAPERACSDASRGFHQGSSRSAGSRPGERRRCPPANAAGW